MSRVNAPRSRACRRPSVTWGLLGTRRAAWRAALSWFTPAGRLRSAAIHTTLLDALHAARSGAVVDTIADRVSCAIVDRALRAAWTPAPGDAWTPAPGGCVIALV